MIELIFFGRGGQGAVTAAQILATAAFREGKYSLAFPSFGPERRGAPVTAYARINELPIVDRSQIAKADYILVLDPKVLRTSNPLNALKEAGCAILNANKTTEDICTKVRKGDKRIYCINATFISEKVYGKRPIPITNIAMLGAFASISRVIKLNTILDTVEHFFSGESAQKSKQAALMANEEMVAGEAS